MGHKAHPIGLRLGVHRKWKSNWYFDSKNYPKFLHLNLDIEKYFKGFLYFYPIKTLLVNCQVIKLPSNHIFIFIFFYRLRKRFKKIKNTLWKTKRWKSNLKRFLINKNIEELPFKFSYNENNKIFLNSFIDNVYKQKSLKQKIFLKNNLNLDIKNFKNLLQNFKINRQKIIILKNLQFEKKSILFQIQYKNKFYLNQLLFFKLLLNNLYLKNVFFKVWLFQVYLFLNNIKQSYNNKNFKFLIKNLYSKNLIKKQRKIKFLKLKKKSWKIFFSKTRNSLNKKTLPKNKIKHLLKLRSRITLKKKKYLKCFAKKNLNSSIKNIKKVLSLISNSKINLIFINSLSFCKFYYYTQKKSINKNYINERFNIWPLQRFLFNRYKYTAIFIKDFIHLAFITILMKNPQVLVNFIGYQFKHLPKNRKQLKLLSFITQTIKILCAQRPEITGFKFQIKGRLNRRTRTRVYIFKKGVLPIQTNITRVEYGYSEGFTRSGLIGIKFWIFYNKIFKIKLKKKLLEYFLYSKYKLKFNFILYVKKYLFLQKKQNRQNNLNLKNSKTNFLKNKYNWKDKNVKTKSTQIQKK